MIIPHPAEVGNRFVPPIDAVPHTSNPNFPVWGRPNCFYVLFPLGAATVRKYRRIVPKMRQTERFLATIGIDDWAMKTLAVISLLALLTITGAAFTDRLLTSDRGTVLQGN
jgi:hypothetical protein